ncbi:MAG: hypothetical protein C4346_03650 [Chloroflexota bacterium]
MDVNGNPANKLVGLQSVTLGPGDGAVVEFTLDEPGTYPSVNHAFGHASQGAVGLLQASSSRSGVFDRRIRAKGTGILLMGILAAIHSAVDQAPLGDRRLRCVSGSLRNTCHTAWILRAERCAARGPTGA